MKNLMYFLPLLFLLQSCANPQKLLEDQRYDKVIQRAAKIFNRKDIKPDKWVTATGIAFTNANKEDLKRMSIFEKKNTYNSWQRVFDLAETINKRQALVKGMLPLVSESGYAPKLKFFKAEEKMYLAKAKIAALYMDAAKDEITYARQGSKQAAIQTVNYIDNALEWRPKIDKARELRKEAADLALVKIEIAYQPNSIWGNPNKGLEKEVFGRLRSYSNEFLEINMRGEDDPDANFYLQVQILDIDVGFDNEESHSDTYTKEIKTGTKRVKEWNESDSCYVWVEYDVFETVSATITEIIQYKDAEMKVLVGIVNAKTGEMVEGKHFYMSDDFENIYYEIDGDERALDYVPITGSWEFFPSAWTMQEDMYEDFAYNFKRFVSSYDWWGD